MLWPAKSGASMGMERKTNTTAAVVRGHSVFIKGSESDGALSRYFMTEQTTIGGLGAERIQPNDTLDSLWVSKRILSYRAPNANRAKAERSVTR
jgi:hypothetical protein